MTAVGMEMFQSKYQHIIDKYFGGKISKSEFPIKPNTKEDGGLLFLCMNL